jgi:hypothetical protein
VIARRPLRLPLAWVVLLLVAPARVSAQPAPGGAAAGAAAEPTRAGATPSETTEISVAGSPASLDWVRALFRFTGGAPPRWSRIDRFEARDVLGADGGARPAVRCWIDLTDARRARIYFAARSGQRFLIRDLELSGAFDELDRATLAEVLELSLSALLEDEQAGLTRAETETLLARRTAAVGADVGAAPAVGPSSPSPSPTPAPVPSGPGVGVFYAVQGFSGQLPIVQGPGVSLSSRFWGGERHRPRAAAWLRVQVQLPQSDRESAIGLRLQAVAPRAGIQMQLPRGLDARLGVGVDLSHLTPLPGAAAGAITLTAPRWSESLLLTAALGTTVAVTRRLELEALVFADYLPSPVDYAVSVNGTTTIVVSPFHLRPGVALAVTLR